MATILHLITGLESGGAERMLMRLVTRLSPGRHRSLVVSMTGPGTLGPELRAAGTTLLSLDMVRGSPDPRGLARLVQILRRVRPDIVQTWLYHADLLGLVGRQLAQVSCRLFWNIRCADMPGSVGIRRLLAWSSRVPDVVIVNSLAGLRFHETIGYRPRRWAHIPNGCDTGEFRFDSEGRRSLRREWGITDRRVAIGLVARYHPMKDHENFLAAAALLAEQCPEVVFILAGAGTDRTNEGLAEAVARHGLGGRIRLLGDRNDMVRVYSALDIMTLSSAYGEGTPNVLVEAMACGRPCIATDCGDSAELLGPEGVIVPRRDPRALAAAWHSLVAAGPQGRAERGERARRRAVACYDLAGIAARYEALYDA